MLIDGTIRTANLGVLLPLHLFCVLQSFEIPDIPVRWYTFKRRPVQSPSALELELPEEAGGETAADALEGSVENEDGDEEGNEDASNQTLPTPPALKAVYARGGGENFLLAMGGWARGAIFECSWEVRVRPVVIRIPPLLLVPCVCSAPSCWDKTACGAVGAVKVAPRTRLETALQIIARPGNSFPEYEVNLHLEIRSLFSERDNAAIMS